MLTVQADESDAYGFHHTRAGDRGTEDFEKFDFLLEVVNVKPDVGDPESRHRESLSRSASRPGRGNRQRRQFSSGELFCLR